VRLQERDGLDQHPLQGALEDAHVGAGVVDGDHVAVAQTGAHGHVVAGGRHHLDRVPGRLQRLGNPGDAVVAAAAGVGGEGQDPHAACRRADACWARLQVRQRRNRRVSDRYTTVLAGV
jgi:hypothetical protein